VTLLAILMATLLAYALGSISPSYLAFRALRGDDIRSVGSGNAGATNVLRNAGRGPAIAVLLADVAKGALPVLVVRQLGLGNTAAACVALAAVTGHVFSMFMGFRGGKGVATAAGALGALNPLAMGLVGIAFLAVVLTTRYVSAGSITAAVSFPIVAFLLGRISEEAETDRAILGASVGIAILILYKHRANLQRLLAGSERRIGEKSTARSDS